MAHPSIPSIVFLILGTAAGAWRAFRLIAASRKTSPRDDVLLEWSEKPLPSLKYEPFAVAAIFLHILAGLALGAIALHASANPGLAANPILSGEPSVIVMTSFIQCGSMAVIGYQLGAMLITIPLVLFRRQPITRALTEKGLVVGQAFLPWQWFSHYAIDSRDGILRLYSVFAPDLPSLGSRPPETVSLAKIDETLRGFIPDHPPAGAKAWYRTKHLLIPTMILVCLTLLLLGWLATHLQRELALFVIALLVNLLAILGAKVINRFAFGKS